MIKLSKLCIKEIISMKNSHFAKLLILFMIISIQSGFAETSYSQVTKLSFKHKKESVKNILNTIEKNSEYVFIYKDGSVDLQRKVSIQADEQTVDKILDELFSETDNSYKIVDRQVYITKKNSDMTESTAAIQQQDKQQVSGVVKDVSGEVLIGVTVAVKGATNIGTMTDIDGKYTLSVPYGSVLTFSYIGYNAKEEVVGNRTVIDVTLSENDKMLDEVVVTALGIKRQSKSIGYSTSQVSGSELTEARDLNLGNALTGKVAGVNVANNATGAAGSSRVIIRGNASLTGNNQPLYVVDGIPFDNTTRGNAGMWGGMDMGDGLNSINPDDIESMQVLKGAAASALYGYRGGNGAILITTKSGSKAKGLGIEFNNNLTINTIYDYRDFQKTYGQGTEGHRPMNSSTAYDTYNSSWGEKMDGGKAVNRLGDEYSYKYVDNWKHFYNTGVTNQTSVSVSGNSNNDVIYRVGLSNVNDWSIIPNAGIRQQGINLNTTFNITSQLHLIINANYVFEKVKNRANLSDGNSNVNASLMYLANSYDVRWLKGMYDANGIDELKPGNNDYFNNPYWLTKKKHNTSRKNRLTAGATLKYDVTDWLYVQGQVTRDGYNMTFDNVQPYGTAQDKRGWKAEYEDDYYELNGSYLIGFDKKLSEKFSLNAALGGNLLRNVYQRYGTDGSINPFIVPGSESSSNIENRIYKKLYEEYRVNSIYATADLGFKDYLFLNLTARNDWFSTLSPDDNSRLYPSVSTSFMFSDAFKMPQWIYSGKVRLAYAQASNGTKPYMNTLRYNMEKFQQGGVVVGTIESREIPNDKLKPVKIEEWEAGLNVQFLDNRLSLDMGVYQKTTTDDIVKISTSITSGYNMAILNVGEIRNRGIESMVFAIPVITKDFQWNTTLNFAYNKSKIVSLGDLTDQFSTPDASSRVGGAFINNVVGKKYGEIYGYKYLRNDKGEIIHDKNGYAMRTEKKESLGCGVPKFTGGFRNEFKYKDFNLSLLLDYRFGSKIFSGTNNQLYATGLHKNTLAGRDGWYASEAERVHQNIKPENWKPTGGYVGKGVTESGAPNTTMVNPQEYWRQVNNQEIAEEYVQSADFIKLRELSIGYNFPKSLLKNGVVKGLYVSLVGRNLWTIMKHTDNVDPESAYNNGNGQGLELNGYPPTRSFGFNVNVKF